MLEEAYFINMGIIVLIKIAEVVLRFLGTERVFVGRVLVCVRYSFRVDHA